MTFNDETLLSAYLDGELEPDERSLIESALLDDPELARRLRELGAVHDLVAGLPRPVLPVDLAGDVGSRIGPGPVRFWPGLRAGGHVFAVRATWGLAAAASVLVALGLALRHEPPARQAAPAPLSRPVETARAPESESVPAVDRAPAAPTGPAAPRLARRTSDPGATARKQREAAAANEIRALLDSPQLRRVFIVTDVIGGDSSGRVEELVQRTPRTEARYGRITVSQGIVIDPLHPQKATVFALVLNEQELKLFQKKLEQRFPQQVEEAEADSIVVGQLAEAGQVAVLEGTPASEVFIPRDVLPPNAFRSDLTRQRPLETTQLAPPFGLPDLAAAAGLGSEPEAALRPNAAGVANSPAPRAPEEPPVAGALADTRATAPAPARGGVAEASPAASGKPPDLSGSLPQSLSTINLHAPPQIVLVWVTSP
jgi:anti-sigma factor RsiW